MLGERGYRCSQRKQRSENRRENGLLQRVDTAGKGPDTVPKSKANILLL